MTQIKRVVVAVLLAVWSFPALSSAAPNRGENAEEAKLPAAVTETAAPRAGAPAQSAPADSETQKLAQREQQTPDLQNFRGGGVSIYIGSGALLVAVIILLIILI
jgi:hypothetical protein